MKEKDLVKLMVNARKNAKLYDAVTTMTESVKNRKEAIAFLIHLAMSYFGESMESDIVLCSWGLLTGYTKESSVGQRRINYISATGYKGSDKSDTQSDASDMERIVNRLIQHELRLYCQLRDYFLSEIENEEDEKEFVAAARKSGYPIRGSRFYIQNHII